jgi:hypothetical protein
MLPLEWDTVRAKALGRVQSIQPWFLFISRILIKF